MGSSSSSRKRASGCRCCASDSFQTCLLHFPCALNISLWPLKSYVRRSYGRPHCVVFNQSLRAGNRFCSWPCRQGIRLPANNLALPAPSTAGGGGGGGGGGGVGAGGSQLTGHEPVQAVERVWCSGRNSGVNSRALGVSGARPCMNREDLNKLFTNLSFPV
ncbi:Hypothetical predicted protein [Lynx pardinus]|uniref:Uncharacterized protein n=1 Tax=Lynx pardinus TaxID=191816 RepID=A0A485NF51_LYNPA|nr:Hypothetical predicted protein [Lynx pardinus]